VPEVIADSRVKFWKVPRLGSMYILKFSVSDYLNMRGLEETIKEYQVNLEKKRRNDESKAV